MNILSTLFHIYNSFTITTVYPCYIQVEENFSLSNSLDEGSSISAANQNERAMVETVIRYDFQFAH